MKMSGKIKNLTGKGYIIGNVTHCCKRCNVAKSDLSENDFLNLVKSIFYNKKLYTHNPVDDAKGNAEALIEIQKMGVKLGIR